MANGPGVSMNELENGTWRIRWREDERRADGSVRRVQRERVVRDEATAIDLRAKVLRAVETGIPFVDQAAIAPPRVATLDEVFRGWQRAQVARGRASATLDSQAAAIDCVLGLLRTNPNRPVPGTKLSRDTCAELVLQLRTTEWRPGKVYAEGTIYNILKAVVQAWTWASDDPVTYPGLLPAPRDLRSVLPDPPIYTPTRAPTMAECDAAIRALSTRYRAERLALPVAILCRFTGLRAGQVTGMQVGDVLLGDEPMVTVRVGKSRRERAEQRTVPVSPHLVEYLIPLVAGRKPEDLLVRRRADATAESRSKPHWALTEAWKEATAKGEARLEVWAPPNRGRARPDHAFRAALQAHLTASGVRDEIIGRLVGHAGGMRDRHYVDASASWGLMREAVGTIPPIDWQAEEAAPDNVFELKR